MPSAVYSGSVLAPCGRTGGTYLLSTSAPAPPPESSALVSGAGTVEADGTYTPRGTNNGKTYYNKEGAGDDPLVSAISWDTPSWIISLSDRSGAYATDEDVAKPWDAAVWFANDGDPPAPAVTEA